MATTFQYIREGSIAEEYRRLKAVLEHDQATAAYLQEVEAHNLTRRKLHATIYYAIFQLIVMILLIVPLIGVNGVSTYDDEFVKTEL